MTVVNASNANGVATSNAAALTAAGFKATASQTSPPTTSITTIEYPANMVSQAKTLSAQIPGAALVADGSSSPG